MMRSVTDYICCTLHLTYPPLYSKHNLDNYFSLHFLGGKIFVL